jgi:hypothetical protein
MVRRRSTEGMAILLDNIELGVVELSDILRTKNIKSVLYDNKKKNKNIQLMTAYKRLTEFINTKITRVVYKINRLNVIFVKRNDINNGIKVFVHKNYYSYFRLFKSHNLYLVNYMRGPPYHYIK